MADAEEVGGPVPKKRRLGQKQRLALLEEANADALAAKQNNALAMFLLEQWAWGHISAQLAQQMASKAIEDMHQDVPGQLQRLAKLGGGYSNKMSADMMASNKSSLCKPFLVHLPYKKKKIPLQKMLLPHELFASIYEGYPDTFHNVLVGPPESLATFWSTNLLHPAMQGHPCLGDMSRKIPLAMHGDGVPITGLGKIWSKTAWVYSWCSLLSDTATKDKQFLIGMVWDTLQGPHTMEKFHEVVAWSFKYLQLGIWPMEDHEGKPHLFMHIFFLVAKYPMHHSYAPLFQHIPRYSAGTLGHKKKGTPLAGGWAGLLFTLQGDMDYFSNVLKLPRWQTKKNCCILCQADSEGVNTWKNFSQTAPWVATSWKTENWRLFPDRSKCKLFEDIPGSSALLCSLDFMHNKFLGCDQYCYGSIMLLLSI